MLEADGLHTAACSGGRYARQEMLPEIGHAGQAKLRRAKVMIVGAGGLGSPVALYLAGAGVGTLTLVDEDVVSLSNLHRQILYAESEVGTSKVAAAAVRLRSLNVEVDIRTHACRLTRENAESLIEGHDVVVDACDKMLDELNPEYAAKKQQEAEIAGLKSQMQDMKKDFTDLMSLLREQLGIGSGTNQKSK